MCSQELAVFGIFLTLNLGLHMRLSFIFLTFQIRVMFFKVYFRLQTQETKCRHNCVYSYWRMKIWCFSNLTFSREKQIDFQQYKCPLSPLFCPDSVELKAELPVRMTMTCCPFSEHWFCCLVHGIFSLDFGITAL